MSAYPVGGALGSLFVFFVAELLRLGANADAVAHLLDSHVFEMRLVHLHEVLAVDVVFWEGQPSHWAGTG